MQKLLTESYTAAVKLLTENRVLMHEISEFLLIKETITGEELMGFVNARKQKEQAAAALEAEPSEVPESEAE